MSDALTAGEFEALTGLTTKALRLYSERGILSPRGVDPVNSYRLYDRDQIGHGLTLDLLRRARVPLSGLADAEHFDFAARREQVTMERLIEDFSLDVAEKLASFDPDDYVAHHTDAPSVDWIGVVLDLGIPDDVDGRMEAFSGLALEVPEVDSALHDVLADAGAPPSDMVWTAVPEASRTGSTRMLIARPAPEHRPTEERVRAHVQSRTGRNVTTMTGTLPRRIEITFTSSVAGDPDLVEEAALGHLHLLAFEHHRRIHGLSALHSTPRQVVRGASLRDGGAPATVFDVHPGLA